MKVGDTIRRKDMPSIKAKILSESKAWGGMFNVKLQDGREGLIDMDDTRWEVVPGGK